MSKPTDIQVIGVALYFLPVKTRVPLKFGAETLTHVTCARVRVHVQDRAGRTAEGWGETPLSIQWSWPGTLPYAQRHARMSDFCLLLSEFWASFPAQGHPLELGNDFLQHVLPGIWVGANLEHSDPMPWLAALVCCSAFDIAVHDAYGRLHEISTYETYNAQFMNRDLSGFLEPSPHAGVDFAGLYPQDFLVLPRPDRLPAWHLVGGLDPLDTDDLTGEEPQDGYPILLADWIGRDGLTCLKIKVRGDDGEWDLERIVRVGEIAQEHGVLWLAADFNCMVTEPGYVNAVLDRLRDSRPRTYGMLLYVEQPFPYDLERHPIDVHSVSARKPLFMDESAHDWRLVKWGRELGWTGVALKTCKTQTGALSSGCWARAHGLSLMVQDLTNPMLAQIPHVLLAAHFGTIMGVETNAMQFYPEASQFEAQFHPGLYRRRDGQIDLSTLQGPGFGYGTDILARSLPPAAVCGGGLSLT